MEKAITKALINVKGEDLLFLDHANRRLVMKIGPNMPSLYHARRVPSVGIWAPVGRGGGNPVPDFGSRQ